MNCPQLLKNGAENSPTAMLVPRDLILLGLLFLATTQSSCQPDEDEWVDPTGDDDDPTDDDDVVPWETNSQPGDYSGSSTGIVSFTGAGQYPCAGTVTVTLDDELVANGEVDCVFPHSGESCGLNFDALELDGGPQALEIDCYGGGTGSLSTWTASDTAIGGRWYRGGEVVSVEFNWYASLKD